MISISYDEESGIVHTIAKGLATIEDFDAYLPQVVNLMARSRSRHGRSLHLVDASDNPVQSKDTFTHIAEASERTVIEGDLCAVVLHSTLARLQIERMADKFDRRFFSDAESARLWLMQQVGANAAE